MNERPQRIEDDFPEDRRVTTPVLIGGGAIAAALIAVAVWYFVIRDPAEPVTEPPAATEASAPAPQPAPTSRPTPPPTVNPAVTLPPLAASDAAVASSLAESVGQQAVNQYLNPGDIIRKFVVTVDNLARPTLPLDRRVAVATPGLFVVEGEDEARTLSGENYARYTPFVTLIENTDASTLVEMYRRYYPLMQEAYLELCNPDTDFDSRVVEVIDHLLATPNVSAPVDLVQPKVLYEYRDPALEGRSAGQKILMRIGPEHATVIKAKLREIRALLTQ